MKKTTSAATKTKKPAAKKAAVKKAAPKAAKHAAAKPVVKKVKDKTDMDLQEFISASLDADKAVDVISINMKGKSAIADFMLIATGTSSRHCVGMANKLRDKLSVERGIKARVEGTDTGDWVIVDAGDIIVHFFRQEVREFYNLEKLWSSDFSTVHYTRYQSV